MDFLKETEKFLDTPSYKRIDMISKEERDKVLEEFKKRGITLREGIQKVPKVSKKERDELKKEAEKTKEHHRKTKEDEKSYCCQNPKCGKNILKEIIAMERNPNARRKVKCPYCGHINTFTKSLKTS